jgi:tRNA 5-methylaminomethyl-2-thiouridine biosynthesis bifunctional protein
MLCAGRIRLSLLVGDITQVLQDESLQVDSWYLDGFSPAMNTDMWSQAVFEQVARLSKVGTSCATYTVAGAVKRGLQQAGFITTKIPGFGTKREMLTAHMQQHEYAPGIAPWFAVSGPAARYQDAITVIGAGIAGLTTACQLVRRGYEVVLLDRHEQVAQGASGNPAGLLLPRFAVDDAVGNAFFMQALIYSCYQYGRMQQNSAVPFWFDTGVDCGVHADKALQLQRDSLIKQVLSEPESATLCADYDWQHYRYAGWLRPAELCRQLLASCAGKLTFLQVDVAAIESSEGCHRIIDHAGHTACESSVVIACNAAGVDALAGLPAFPLAINSGQVTVVECPESGQLPATPMSANAYCTPVFEGRFCTGASYRNAPDNSEVTAKDHRFNLENLQCLLPAIDIDSEALQGRVAERASSPDRFPIVGAVPDIDYFKREYHDLRDGKRHTAYPAARHMPGMYINVAHGSRGLTTAFLAAEIIASMVDGAPLPVSRKVQEYLNPARFIVRQLKKSQVGTI